MKVIRFFAWISFYVFCFNCFSLGAGAEDDIQELLDTAIKSPRQPALLNRKDNLQRNLRFIEGHHVPIIRRSPGRGRVCLCPPCPNCITNTETPTTETTTTIDTSTEAPTTSTTTTQEPTTTDRATEKSKFAVKQEIAQLKKEIHIKIKSLNGRHPFGGGPPRLPPHLRDKGRPPHFGDPLKPTPFGVPGRPHHDGDPHKLPHLEHPDRPPHFGGPGKVPDLDDLEKPPHMHHPHLDASGRPLPPHLRDPARKPPHLIDAGKPPHLPGPRRPLPPHLRDPERGPPPRRPPRPPPTLQPFRPLGNLFKFVRNLKRFGKRLFGFPSITSLGCKNKLPGSRAEDNDDCRMPPNCKKVKMDDGSSFKICTD